MFCEVRISLPSRLPTLIGKSKGCKLRECAHISNCIQNIGAVSLTKSLESIPDLLLDHSSFKSKLSQGVVHPGAYNIENASTSFGIRTHFANFLCN